MGGCIGWIVGSLMVVYITNNTEGWCFWIKQMCTDYFNSQRTDFIFYLLLLHNFTTVTIQHQTDLAKKKKEGDNNSV